MALSATRREFLLKSLKLSAYVSLGPTLLSLSQVVEAKVPSAIRRYGDLAQPDANDIRLPRGFKARVIAESRQKVAGYRWHRSPDGGACFPTESGGWNYVSNCEEFFLTGGGASAIEFDAQGQIIAARRVLGGTTRNCAGGATPWNTWLSCEERDLGLVWECDPKGVKSASSKPALGAFKHEAVAVDPVYEHLYLTEDESDGCFYRFIPANGLPNLDAGELQVAEVDATGGVSWVTLPNPRPRFYERRTRKQIDSATRFNGGEGIWYHDGFVFFTTKGDNRVWVLDTQTQSLDILYDKDTSSNPILSGVDNVTVSPLGDILVAEDGGDMQIVLLDAQGNASPFLQIIGQDSSEITGPAFSPDGKRLYFSSQRGKSVGRRLGYTYEVTGPF